MTTKSNYINKLETLLVNISSKENCMLFLNEVQKKIDNKNSKMILEKLDKFVFKGVDNLNISNSIISALNECDNFGEFEALITNLKPWRKGPFKLNSLVLDSEWQCQKKWDRLSPKVSFKNKAVLDVGTGNGYYLYRLIGEDTKLSVGLDPHLLYIHQALCLNKFFQLPKFYHLPIGWEHCDKFLPIFDTVMCMGVLYHQKNPIELLEFLKKPLKKFGELILETLIIDSEEDTQLVPLQRYAAMKNVFSIPSKKRLVKWLKEAGYQNIKVLDVNQTDINEQRSTAFSSSMSLIDFLDPVDKSKTIEGHPRPLRILLKASL